MIKHICNLGFLEESKLLSVYLRSPRLVVCVIDAEYSLWIATLNGHLWIANDSSPIGRFGKNKLERTSPTKWHFSNEKSILIIERSRWYWRWEPIEIWKRTVRIINRIVDFNSDFNNWHNYANSNDPAWWSVKHDFPFSGYHPGKLINFKFVSMRDVWPAGPVVGQSSR